MSRKPSPVGSNAFVYVVLGAVVLSLTAQVAIEFFGLLLKVTGITDLSVGERLLSLGGMLLLALFLAAWVLERIARHLRSLASTEAELLHPDTAPKSRVVVIGLSPFLSFGVKDAEAHERWQRLKEAGIIQAALPKGSNPLDDLGATRHPWTMALCAVAAHLDRLEHVFIIPSKETEKDARELFHPDLQAMLKDAGLKTQVHLCPDVNYLDYDETLGGFEHALGEARQTVPGLSDADICIDATPGQKPFSVAAAVTTFTRESLFSYVNTADRKAMVYRAQIKTTFFADAAV